ncbi:MAG: hypothetical protein L6R41_006737 [Letrouitia leprolyta]|nr:MAG: hypothetical protein L6R41_006737 [Letrouitia leprolyta]
MATTLRHAFVPTRISQLYANTKRTYEHMIQHNVTNIPQTATHTKLRIQKDRLIAWGLEWEDSNATQNGNIDDSLDRAGISDLVGSIMSSIQDLLERADSIQPQRTISFPGPFPNDKPTLTSQLNSQWTTQDMDRLNDIVKDLTTSIDTLCDLSRSRQALGHGPRLDFSFKASQSPTEQSNWKGYSSSRGNVDLIDSSRLSDSVVQMPDEDLLPTWSSSPPSYESVAAGSEDRVLASMLPSDKVDAKEKFAFPILLEYLPSVDAVSTGQYQPSPKRYHHLMQVQPTALAGFGPTYLGSLKLRGWIEDIRRGRIALVYEIPLPDLDPSLDRSRQLKVFTLLSFLHHGADTDSTNMPSLEDRFRLAFNLASSLLHLHAKKLFHRNINSRNVVFFISDDKDVSDTTKPWKRGVIRRPFLTAFDQCSEDVLGEIEESFISNIYRHPDYERGQRSRFKPFHDIYSLGLILLEIGLWMPLSKLWKTKYTRSQFRHKLQTIYTRKLAGKCGTKYMNVVEFCLQADDPNYMVKDMDPVQSSQIDPLTASQNSLYWKAFKALEKCCMIDDANNYASPVNDVPSGTEHEKTGSQSTSLPWEKQPTPEKIVEQKRPEPLLQEVVPSSSTEGEPRANETRRCKCKVWSHEIPSAFSTHWQQTLEPRLNRMFSKIIDRWESYSIELLMTGETAELARPTIYMVCASVEKARKVLQYVNQDQGLFDIKVSKGQILRSKAGKKKKRGKGKKSPSAGNSAPGDGGKGSPLRFHHYQERPSCGASIGAYLDEQHLPPVSFGGTVLVGGEPYGMSVHHMLENDEIDFGLNDAAPLHRSMAPPGKATRESEEDLNRQWGIGGLPEALYPFEISDDDDEGYRSSAEDEDLSDFDPSQWDTPELIDLDDVDMGDTPGVEPGHGETLLVTQPAIDDVDEGFFPNEEDIDEDHLASHTFGHIHASSGIRRTSRGPISHEVDWALIKIREHRQGKGNAVKDGTQHCHTANPNRVLEANKLGGLQVHALGRTSGLQTGTILPSMVTVKMPGRVSHSQSWQVAGKFGMGGDSGAWVIDNATGGVCAHVLAWSERNNTAYVAPMEVLFEDMAQTLGADVTLPEQEMSLPEEHASSPIGTLTIGTASLAITKETSSDGHSATNTIDDLGKDPKQDQNQAQPEPSIPTPNPTLSRESTISPPVATSPLLQRRSQSQIPNPIPDVNHPAHQQQRFPNLTLSQDNNNVSPAFYNSVSKSCTWECKGRKSGSEILLEKGEGGFKKGCRMSIG